MTHEGFLIPGGAQTFRPAGGCPVAMAEHTNGLYFPHRGDSRSFLTAEARVTDGSAAIVLTLWRCVYCHTIIAGIGKVPPGEITDAELTWLEEVP